MSLRNAIVSVLLPFAVGYYLSYLFRTINALSSSALGADLHFGAAELGSLTSAYFFTFAAMQLPIGIALDRFGPRRVQLALMPVAGAGSALFAVADNFSLLLLSRALIGLGVAAALMAGLKALVLWFPKERLALANGCYIMLEHFDVAWNRAF
jgi:MFS family permease